MTTAHRPTWKAAVGKASEGQWQLGGISTQRSAKDVASHKKLKYLAPSQRVQKFQKSEVIKESLRKLKEVEDGLKRGKRGGDVDLVRSVRREEDILSKQRIEQQKDEVDLSILSKYDDADDSESDDQKPTAGGGDISGEDDDDESDLDNSSESDSDDDSGDDDSSDSEDEEIQLQAELAKLKREREESKLREQEKLRAEEEASKTNAALLGNPLLQSDSMDASGKQKRKWNDDVVFRNQSRSEPEDKGKRFINDTVRNDFHKRFISKYCR